MDGINIVKTRLDLYEVFMKHEYKYTYADTIQRYVKF